MTLKILELWTASPTFQRQCIRLAEANITVAVGLSPLLRPGLRATSKILMRDGRVFFVSTTLRDDLHVEEDLPHELEHVMEQIEARNLARDSEAGRGAWPSGPHAYETERARLAGIRAANEVQDARRSGPRPPVSLLGNCPLDGEAYVPVCGTESPRGTQIAVVSLTSTR